MAINYKKVLKSKKAIKVSFKIPHHRTSTEYSHDNCDQDDLSLSSNDLRDDPTSNLHNLEFMT